MVRRLGLASLGLASGMLLTLPSAASAQISCKAPIVVHSSGAPGVDNMTATPVEGKPNVSVRRLTGNVEIICDDTRIYADEIEYVDDSDWVYARGHVLFEQPTVRINAESARLNRKSHLGTFTQVIGSIQMHQGKPPSDQFGGMEPDVIFSGKTLEKTGPKTYKLSDGEITTCTQPTPRWDMGTSSAVITPGEHVVMTTMVLRVKDVPVFYLPVLYYPINMEGRSTGLLMPTYGSSSLTGTEISNAFFVAIDRSQDATFYHDWYQKTGQGLGAQYRYALPQGSNGIATFDVVDQHASTVGTTELPAQKTYTLQSNVNQALPDNFRFVSNVNYFSSVTSQQLYQQNLADLASRTSTLNGNVSGSIGRYRLSVDVARQDYFNSASPAQRLGHLPDINFAVPDTPIGHTQIYYGLADDTTYRVDQSNVTDPTTDRSLWRQDFLPTIRVPITNFPFLNITTTGSWRLTTWSKSSDPANSAQAIDAPVWREIFEVQTTIDGPTFSRVFNTPDGGFAEKWKHVIEPKLTFDWKSPFDNRSAIIQQDATDYLVGGTTNITYGITNHLLARKKAAGGATGQSGEVLTVSLQQTYATNPLAAALDTQFTGSAVNPATATGVSNFTPVQLNATATPTQRLNGTFYLNYDTHFHGISTLGASTRLTDGTIQLQATWNKTNVVDGNPQGFELPGQSLTWTTAYKPANKHVGGSYEFSWDIANHTFVEQRAAIYYNSQCCGISMNYQRLAAFGSLQADTRFGVSITLAGLGSFSNPMGTMGAMGDNSAIR